VDTQIINDGDLSPHEEMFLSMNEDAFCFQEIVMMSSILANGVKLFRLPAAFWEPLKHIAIPLTSLEYFQPFPALIVELPNGSFHYVCHRDGLLTVLDCNKDAKGNILCVMPGMTIEEYLTPGESPAWRETENSELAERVVLDEGWQPHRYRATLNFLLLCAAEGILSEGRLSTKREHGVNRITKLANPEVFRPQAITLFREHSISEADPNAQGPLKRPHWRRLHWRRVPCGVGRCERRLTLIQAVLVNKGKFTGDLADTEYVAAV